MKYVIPAAIITVAWLAAACGLTVCGFAFDDISGVWIVAGILSVGLMIFFVTAAISEDMD